MNDSFKGRVVTVDFLLFLGSVFVEFFDFDYGLKSSWKQDTLICVVNLDT